MKRNFFIQGLLAAGVISALAVPASANIITYVGYADELRPSPFFPNPWNGSAGVALYAGDTSTNIDAGAIRLHNDGVSAVTINNLSVQINPGLSGPTFNLWSASFPFLLGAGMDAIFTQTVAYNFDTSDYALVAPDLSNNCSVGALASSALCLANIPTISLTVDGVTSDLLDTSHVLNTGGFDLALVSNSNESLNWRPIGTTGVENPSGQSVPEPEALSLLGLGLAALGLIRTRRKA